MRSRSFWVTVAASTAIAIVSALEYRGATTSHGGKCQVCERDIHRGVSYRMDTAKGSEVTCCPRCGMHYQITHSAEVERTWATDLDTGETLPALAACYLEGRDLEFCTRNETPVRREPQGISIRGYDRCLPTLVAFGSRSQAEAYRTRHGGRVLNYEQAMESVKQK